MSESKVMRCDCSHAFQDSRYGAGKRVHNRTSGTTPSWRCTSCGTENRTDVKAKKKAK